MTSTTLWRPIGPAELELVRAADWIPAEELDDFNDNLVGEIEIVHEFR
ncbi:hypothetical protein [Kutzneria sp. NPDC051319]